MKAFKKIIAALTVALTIGSFNLFAEKNETSNNTKLAAISQVIHEQKKPREDGSLLKLLHVKNSVPDLLKLDAEFENPQDLDRFLDHFEFLINGEVIPVYKSKPLIVRTDKPFTISIKAKRGKIESLLALIKSKTQNWLKQVYAKAANLLTVRISFDCPVQEHNIQAGTIEMDELIYQHPVMRNILKNPSEFMNTVKPYLSWSEWFGLEAKLPELEYQDS